MKPHKHFSACLVFLLLCSNIQLFAANGSETDPWLITSVPDLEAFRDGIITGEAFDYWGEGSGTVAAGGEGQYFCLTADLDLSSVCHGGDGETSWTPIGTNSNPFKGKFKGQGHTISNLYINVNESYQGLFGCIEGATIDSLHLVATNITGAGYVGGICGYAINYSTISACTNSGSVNDGAGYVGGICGYAKNQISITDCTNSCSVSGTGSYVGGVCGWIYTNCLITNSTNSGNINGNSNFVAGVCGKVDEASRVTACANSGNVSVNVSGYQNGTGGIGGDIWQSTIENCTNSGDVSGVDDVGGVFGVASDNSHITACTNSGNIRGNGVFIGGVCGKVSHSSLTYCINSGNVSGNAQGVCGKIESSSVTHCYYDSQMCLENDADNQSKLTAELASGVLPTGFTAGDWEVVANLYPRPAAIADSVAAKLAALPIFLQNGEKVDNIRTNFTVSTAFGATWSSKLGKVFISGEDVFLLATGDDTLVCTLNGISKEVPIHISAITLTIDDRDEFVAFRDAVIAGASGVYKTIHNDDGFADVIFLLTDNIDLSSVCNAASNKSWTPIGTPSAPFKGKFKGKGHTISNLYINVNEDYQGLFGYIASATIDSLHLIATNVTGGSNVGGVCGWAEESCNITNCTNSGSVSGMGYIVGGVCGWAEESCNITNCTNSGSVSGTRNYVGGVCGYAYSSTITACTNSGSVSGTRDYVGGVCGEASTNSTITAGTNSGSVSGNNSYVGGVCGFVRDYNSAITNCTNSGSVSGGGICVGGVCGYAFNNSTITACTNSGNVSGTRYYVGGVCGFNNSSTITNCYYDKQMCLTGGIGIDNSAIGNDEEDQAEGKFTTEMTGTQLYDDSENWTEEDNLYPRPFAIAETDVAKLSALPIFLQNEETVNDIRSDFTVSTSFGAIWSSKKKLVKISENGEATIVGGGDDILVCTLPSGENKEIEIKVFGPVPYIEAADYDGVYDGAAHTISVSGTLDGDQILYSTDGENWQTSAPARTDAGETKVFVKISRTNFEDWKSEATIKISQCEISIEWPETSSFVYDGNEHSFAASPKNIVDGDEVSFAYTGTQSATNAGDYSLTISGLVGGNAANYKLPSSGLSQTWEITKAEISGIEISGFEGVYDGEPHTISVSGTLDGDQILYSTDGENWQTSAPARTDAGETKVFVKVSRTNFEDWKGEATIKISQREISIEWPETSSFVYDGNEHSFAASPKNIVDGDEVSFAYTGTQSATNAGDYSLTISGLVGGNAANYKLPSSGLSQTWKITKAEISGIEISGFEGVYDGEAHTISVSGTLDGDQILYSTDGENWQTSAPARTDAGETKVFVKVCRTNFEDWKDEATIKISQCEISIEWQETSSFVYDGNEHSFAATPNNVVEGDEVNFAYTGTQSATNAGDYSLTISGLVGGNAANYKLPSSGLSQTWKITKAEISGVEVAGYDGVYDGEAHTISVSGTLDGDQILYSTDGENWQTSAPARTDAGETKVFVKVSRTNFEDWKGEATIKISQCEISIEWPETSSFVYDGNEQSFAASPKNIVDGDEVNFAYTGTQSATNAGDYSLTISGLVGGKAANYKLPSSGLSQTWKITKAEISGVEISGFEGVYDGAAHTISVSGTLDGDQILYSTDGENWQTSAPARTDAGETKVFVKVSRANFEDWKDEATIKISQCEISIEWPETSSFVYNGNEHSFAATPKNIVDSDEVSFAYTGTQSATNAGDYSLTISGLVGGKAANYKLPSSGLSQTWKITKAEISGVEVAGYDGVYDGEAHTISVSGTLDGDQILYSTDGENWQTSAPARTDAGETKVFVKVSRTNFEDWKGEATIKISQREISIEWPETSSFVYNGNEHSFAASPKNIVDGDEVSFAYTGTQSATNAGDYSLTISGLVGGKAANYKLPSSGLSQTWKITKAEISGVEAADYDGVYDGEAHTISVSGTLDGDQILYSTDGENWQTTAPIRTDAGETKVFVKVSRTNFEDWKGEATIKINPEEEDPIEENPIEDDPIEDDPIEDDPIKDEPIEDDPIEDEPIEDEPIEDEPIVVEPVEYQIEYNTGVVTIQNPLELPNAYTDESKTAIPNAVAVKDFYTFEGWHLDSEDGAAVSNTADLGSGNHTLYATFRRQIPDVDIVISLGSILAIHNANSYPALKSATTSFAWSRNGTELIGNRAFIEVGSPIPSGTYRVVIRIDDEMPIVLERTLGENISVFPNPAKPNNKVKATRTSAEIIRCEMVDSKGDIYNAEITETEDGYQISTPATSGFYIMRLIGENGAESTQKIIVR